MRPIQMLQPVRWLIICWVTSWITTVPLFHLHIPDKTDYWAVLHSGGAHTVFTPDLPGEFCHPFNDTSRKHSSHLSHRIVNSPELGIALYEEERKAKSCHVLQIPHYFDDIPEYCSLHELPRDHRDSRLFAAFPASRAPPRIDVLS
jgi:hypothetical protein